MHFISASHTPRFNLYVPFYRVQRLPALVDEGERIARESLEADREVVVKADGVVDGCHVQAIAKSVLVG